MRVSLFCCGFGGVFLYAATVLVEGPQIRLRADPSLFRRLAVAPRCLGVAKRMATDCTPLTLIARRSPW
jgi:hypothetical protein